VVLNRDCDCGGGSGFVAPSLIQVCPVRGLTPVCVFVTVVPIIKLFAWGEGDNGGQRCLEAYGGGP
jgi:hypothetical protein